MLISKKESLVNLVESTQQELDYFSKLVGNNKGTLVFLVHPFFDEKYGSATYRSSLSYVRLRRKFISRCLESNVPMVFAEEQGAVANLQGKLPISPNHTAYVVPTEEYNPTLIDYKRHWPNLVFILRESGVKKITVGGRYMVFSPTQNARTQNIDPALQSFALTFQNTPREQQLTWRWLNREVIPIGCAGTMAMWLSQAGFDISISPISSPGYIEDVETYFREVNRYDRVENLPRTQYYPHLEPDGLSLITRPPY